VSDQITAIPLTRIDGEIDSLANHAGKVLLIVNVASKCGLTPQYEGLEALYREKHTEGLQVLAFPANNFNGQEPGTDDQILDFCKTSYDVTFPLFSKIEVNGKGAHPLYQWLTAAATEPVGAGPVSWNFEKFVIGKDGRLVARFSPRTAPDAPALLEALATALA
jgi:glutathione peroxidase